VESVRFEFLVDPSNPNTRFTKEFFTFKDGTPEDYIKWLMGYRDLELLMPLKEPLERTKMLVEIVLSRLIEEEERRDKREKESLVNVIFKVVITNLTLPKR